MYDYDVHEVLYENYKIYGHWVSCLGLLGGANMGIWCSCILL